MSKKLKKSIVFSLGGSIIFPEGGIDVRLLKKYRELIKWMKKDYEKILIVCGGGTICRKYQAALKKISDSDNDDIDWMGLYVTRVNAQLVRLSLREFSFPEVIIDPNKKRNFKELVLVGGGSKPGWSTDYVAATFAKTYGIDELVNLSNIKFVYDKDPKKYQDAKPLKELSWKEMGQFIPRNWKPGLNSPIDPTAYKLASNMKLKVAFLSGTDVNNLKKYLKGESFKGTIVQ